MKKICLTILMGAVFMACSSKTGRGIEYVSPCACYEIEKLTSNKG